MPAKLRDMRVSRDRARAAGLGLLVLVAAAGAGADELPERVIHYERDTLTVRLVKVPLSDVLDEVSRQSGAEIRGQLRSPREVSAEFDGVSVPEALYRLLGDQNFALVYGDAGRLRTVKLLGGPLGDAPAVIQAAAPAAAGPPVSPADLMTAMDRHLPVPVSGRVQQVLGSETASLRQLLEIGLHNEDAAVRADAVRTSLQVLETEPELRSAVVSTMNGMDDAQITSFVRAVAGERAEELAMHVATQSRVGELKVKASSVLQKLRSGS